MNKKYFLLLFVILLIASFFRLWQLSTIPPGLYPDVAMNGMDALETLENNNWKLFYENNNGREGVFIWLVALAFYWFGVSIWSLKIFAPIFGILTVLGTYFLAKEIFKNNKYYAKYTELAALTATFFISVSLYHVLMSRIGFRAIMAPFCLTFGFYFLIRTLRERKYLLGFISGLFLALGFYTYISYRFAVVLLFIFLLAWILPTIKNKLYFLNNLKIVLFTLFVIFFAALPIGIYFLQNPGDFFGRATGVSVFEAENPIKETIVSVALHLGMFNIMGDGNWRHNLSTSPQLFWPMGIFFLIGFFILFKYIREVKKERNTEEFAITILALSWFFIFLMPGFLSSEGSPHALRVLGTIPIIYIISAFGFIFAYDKGLNWAKLPSAKFGWKSQLKNKQGFLTLLLCIFFGYTALAEYNRYFIIYANNPNLNWAFTQDYYNIGEYLNNLPEETKKYIIVNELEHPLWGISIPAQSIMFMERTKFSHLRASYIKAQDINDIEFGEQKTVIVPLYKDSILDVLKEKFPQAQILNQKGFIVYKIN